MTGISARAGLVFASLLVISPLYKGVGDRYLESNCLCATHDSG
jgi:hypothetical protein